MTRTTYDIRVLRRPRGTWRTIVADQADLQRATDWAAALIAAPGFRGVAVAVRNNTTLHLEYIDCRGKPRRLGPGGSKP